MGPCEYLNKAIANMERREHVSPPNTPSAAELVELFRQTDWRLPCYVGQPALHFAVTYDGESLDLLKALVNASVDLRTTYDGETVLDYAARLNAREAIAFLRAQPVNWGEAGEEGQAPLQMLVSWSHQGGFRGWVGTSEVTTLRAVAHAEFLLEHGADVNAKDKDGYTVLDVAIRDEAPNEFTQMLIEHGAVRAEKSKKDR
jgi:hypothetical protein